MHGIWCVGACWALMLFPMLLIQGHMISMVIVTIVMIGERLERPRALSWRLRGTGKLMRIVIAQVRLRLGLRSAPGSKTNAWV